MDFLNKVEQALTQLTHYDEAHIDRVFEELKPTAEDVSRYLLAPKGLEYGRNVIFKNDNSEVILVYLPPLAKTLVHDHGYSNGWIYIVEGNVLNMIYEEREEELLFVDSQLYKREETFSVSGETTHAMLNPALTPAISLHVYSPPLGRGRVFFAKEDQQVKPHG
ncbi:cysteine dioxygenase [Fictibacillus iocasae]|uniref:Cysteine dioxygenase n=1 Tax=Fictibacillus iocasae TaxID=2715437 RepID=A0ABW2NMB6_9BACL